MTNEAPIELPYPIGAELWRLMAGEPTRVWVEGYIVSRGELLVFVVDAWDEEQPMTTLFGKKMPRGHPVELSEIYPSLDALIDVIVTRWRQAI